MPAFRRPGLARVAAVVSCWLAAAVATSLAHAQGVRPGELLIYYGYPSAINATYSVPLAAAEFSPYDIVVWGDGLDDPVHPDHANAAAILATPAMSATRVFGYVDLGVATQNLGPAAIELRITRWKQMGASGVFLDDFGYDFGTTRARQNAAVAFAHSLGMPVIANAWVPDDAFSANVHPTGNPAGVPTALGAGDYYLYESHGIREGVHEAGAVWSAKCSRLAAYQQSLGFGVISVTTTLADGATGFDADGFAYAWHAAQLAGHVATGWGEYGFSAVGASNCVAPHRARPSLAAGSIFTSALLHDGDRHWRTTDSGVLRLDSGAHTYSFQSGFAGAGPSNGIRELRVAPNPAIHAARASFSLLRETAVHLVVFDLAGREVATLADREMPAGRHEVAWDLRSGQGTPVSPGLYLLTLTGGQERSAARVLVAR